MKNILKKALEIELKNKSNKIFGIGLPKTGTTSLNEALKILGYRSIQWCRELYLIHSYGKPISQLSGILNPTSWDALSNSADHIYPLMDKEFPNSKFILTIRDKESWLKSVENYLLPRSPIIDEEGNIEGGTIALMGLIHVYGHAFFNKEYLPIMYDNHLRNAKHYFKKRKKDLLIIDICGVEGWNRLCPFLCRDIPNIPFPHNNKTTVN